VERYAVEGSTLLGWTIHVDANGPGEAVEEAQRIASLIDVPQLQMKIHGVDHSVVRCQDAPESAAEAFVEIW
jgi:hypothetical protein